MNPPLVLLDKGKYGSFHARLKFLISASPNFWNIFSIFIPSVIMKWSFPGSHMILAVFMQANPTRLHWITEQGLLISHCSAAKMCFKAAAKATLKDFVKSQVTSNVVKNVGKVSLGFLEDISQIEITNLSLESVSKSLLKLWKVLENVKQVWKLYIICYFFIQFLHVGDGERYRRRWKDSARHY